MEQDYQGRVGFAIGTGRCGTLFLARALALEPGVSSVHERNPLNEAFHRYSKWYSLPVDDEGFLHAKKLEIDQDLRDHRLSFEASPYLSLSVSELYSRFGAKFILLVRTPERMVNSYLRKGWYELPFVRSNSNLALGYQHTEPNLFHFFLGRIVPSGQEYSRWNRMTRVGKLSWYWSALNSAALRQFEEVPKTHWRIQKLEDLSYAAYCELARFLELKASVAPRSYRRLVNRRPNALHNIPTIADWSSVEAHEFEKEVGPIASMLGYEFRVNRLSAPTPKQAALHHRVESSLRTILGPVRRRIIRKLGDPYLGHTWDGSSK